MRLSLYVVLFILITVSFVDCQYIVQTVAGNHQRFNNIGSNGNGGLATAARFDCPRDVAVDDSNNLFIADEEDHSIRFVNKTSGIISTVAGTGSGGYGGDGGLATMAKLNTPFSVAVDTDGNFYIADSGNHVVRFVNKSTGIISTIAGTGSSGFSGDGDLAIRAQLQSPRGIKVDKMKNIYIADTSNHVIRFVNKTTGVISTIAGIGGIGKVGSDGILATDSTLYYPFDVSVDVLSNLYIADSSTNRIRFVSKNTGIISTLAKHPAIVYPNGVAVDSALNVFIASTASFQVKLLNSTSQAISTIGGNGTQSYSGDGGIGGLATFKEVYGIDFDSRGNVYISDAINYVIRVLIKTCDGLFHCNNHGACLSSTRCACDLGWSGKQCTIPICFGLSANDTNTCSGHGKCLHPDMCECIHGTHGNNCQYYYCHEVSSSDSSVCSGRGTCVGFENCTCSANYFGGNCEKTTCFSTNSTSDTVCSGRGRCISFNNCSCPEGYNGKECEFTSCHGTHSTSPNVCSGNGNCSSFNNCTCNNGYIGNNCQVYSCFGLASNDLKVCSSHGQCSPVNNCTCEPGYYDPICSSFNCNGVKYTESKCENNGTCTRPGTCECVPGYEGNKCEFPICYGLNSSNPAVCSHHGNCPTVNQCICKLGWRGLTCNITDCNGKESFAYDVCSGNGECVEKDVCFCKEGYAGENCDLLVCFGKNSNETKTCSSRGECVSPNTCQCFSGYNGEECQHHEVILDSDTVSLYSSHPNLMKELSVDIFSCHSMFTEQDILKLGDSFSRKCHWRFKTGFMVLLGYNHTVTNGLVLTLMRRFTIKVNSSNSDSKRIAKGMGITIGKTLDLYTIRKDLLVRSDANIDYHNFRENKQEWYCSSCSSEIQSILNRNENKPIFIIPAAQLSYIPSSNSKELTISTNSKNDLQEISTSSRNYIFSQSETLPSMFNVWNDVYFDTFIQDCVGHNCIIESSIIGHNTSLTYTFNGFLIVLSKDFQDKQIFRIVNKFGSVLLENNYKGIMQVVGLNLISFRSSYYQVDLSFTAYDNIDLYLTNTNKTHSKDSDIEIGTVIMDPFVYEFSSVEGFLYNWTCQNVNTMQWITAFKVSPDGSTLYLGAGDLSVGHYHVILYLTTSKSKYSFYSSLHITDFPKNVPSIIVRQHSPSIYPFGTRFSVKLSIFSETPLSSIEWVLLEGTLLTSDIQSVMLASTTTKPLYGNNVELELNVEAKYLIGGEQYCFQLLTSNENGISSANITTVIDMAPRFNCDLYDPLGEDLAFLSKFVITCVNTRESISSWWIDLFDGDGNRLMILSNTVKKSFITRLPHSPSGILNIGIKLINKNGSFSRMNKKFSIKNPISDLTLTSRVEFIVRSAKSIVSDPVSTDTSVLISTLISFIDKNEDFSQLDPTHIVNLKNTLLSMISSLRKIQDISLFVDDKIIQLVVPPLTKIVVVLERLAQNSITETVLGQWIKWIVNGVRTSNNYYTPCIMNHLLDDTHTKELKELFQILITKSIVTSFDLLPQVFNIINKYSTNSSSTLNFDFNESGEGYYEEIAHSQQLEGKYIQFSKNKNIELEFPIGISQDLNFANAKMISYVHGTTQKTIPSSLSPTLTLALLSETGDGLKVEELKHPIRIKFTELFIHHNDTSKLDVICVYYDFSSQSWIQRGIVSEINITKVEPGIIYFNMTCHTNHLTSFSVQQVLPRNTSSPIFSSDQTLTLIISIVTPLSIFLMISLIIIAICVFVSVYRNRYWNKRIRNEKEMEQKLLDIELEMNDKSQNISYLIPIQELQLVKKIGEGGFGQVYLAKWKQVQVAVKCVSNLEGNEILDEDDDMFEKEVLLLNSLKHPNVIHFYGICLTETKKLMIMEYLEGGSLDKIIAELRLGRRKMTLGEKIKILFGVSNGMSYLHNLKPKSIIHRDLKTANILLDNFMQPKVCDFGLSKLIGNNNSTKMTTNLGSIFYMAPELMGDGGEKISNKLDVYSYGIIMYELLFEDNPYLNQGSPKINRFSQTQISELNSFSVPIKVSNGFRPKIPYSDIKEKDIWISEFLQEEKLPKQSVSRLLDLYLSLMKQCWDTEPDIRPSFDSIGQSLADIMTEFHI